MYGDHTVDKLAKALGRGYGPDNLRIFARIASAWTQAEFEPLAARGLDISDFRELAKLADASTRARVEQQAIENDWPLETLKAEVRKAAGQVQPQARTKKTEQVQHETPVLTVTDALNTLVTGQQPRVDEQARLRNVLDQIDPQAAQALAPQITQAIEAVRAERAALGETEQLLIAALALPAGGAA